ncbi:hypothetical protein FA13DRAFT_3489 [Coprinellus micaceus]|uniref:F-box domain-containing protein n=1 Tax=Coprinellus micaceus TaxID=71717 RepID=A0A4Y7U079_COPMI|nr:hypothetical protein FA13DRAFT_3489 [Coprinellus micaceus]
MMSSRLNPEHHSYSHRTTAMSSLPQEVLDEIVRHVDTDVEPESLFQPFPSHRNLALAARCFVHSSYSRIYEKVKFRHESQTSFGRPRTTPTYRKRINFETHPRLIRYIRHVEVSAAFAFPRRKSNGELHRSFASITERLTKVTRVQLHSSLCGGLGRRGADVPRCYSAPGLHKPGDRTARIEHNKYSTRYIRIAFVAQRHHRSPARIHL